MFDPNEALIRLRARARILLRRGEDEMAMEMSEAFQALDQHIMAGEGLPSEWSEAYHRKPSHAVEFGGVVSGRISSTEPPSWAAEDQSKGWAPCKDSSQAQGWTAHYYHGTSTLCTSPRYCRTIAGQKPPEDMRGIRPTYVARNLQALLVLPSVQAVCKECSSKAPAESLRP